MALRVSVVLWAPLVALGFLARVVGKALLVLLARRVPRENGVLLVPLAKMVFQGPRGFRGPRELRGLLVRKGTRGKLGCLATRETRETKEMRDLLDQQG